MSERFLLLGAGLAGLSAAWHLEQEGVARYALFEQSGASGGLCRSLSHGPFTFDYQGHVFHFSKPWALHFVKRFLGQNLQEHRRNTWVYTRGAYLQYPFQGHLSGLSPRRIAECLTGRALTEGETVHPNGQYFSDWSHQVFGKGISRHFMLPYNRKLWRGHFSCLTARWVQPYVPIPTLEETIRGALRERVPDFGYNATFWYPKRGGVGALATAIEQSIQPIQFHHRAVRVDWKRRRVVFAGGRVEPYDRLISSIPLVVLGRLLHMLPASLRRAWRQLRYVSVSSLHVGVKWRGRPPSKHWIYFPDSSVSFFRVGCPSAFCDQLGPEGTVVLYAETAEDPENPTPPQEAAQRILRDLRRVRLLRNESDVLAYQHVRIPMAYIVYDHRHEDATSAIHEFLHDQGIDSIGRFGRWRYTAMEDALEDGRDVARRLAPGRAAVA